MKEFCDPMSAFDNIRKKQNRPLFAGQVHSVKIDILPYIPKRGQLKALIPSIAVLRKYFDLQILSGDILRDR
jgi:hypothetical protein